MIDYGIIVNDGKPVKDYYYYCELIARIDSQGHYFNAAANRPWKGWRFIQMIFIREMVEVE